MNKTVSIKKYCFALVLCLCFALTAPTYAQVTAVSLNVSPDNTEVGDIITVTASSYSENLSRSTFTWTANGKVIKQGVGVTSISFKKRVDLPTVTIGVSINLSGGETIEQSVDITNQSLDLLWEAINAYTPPWYEGKALPIQESAVRFSPIPARGSVFGSSGNKNILYTWSRSNDVVGNSSGTGRDSFPIVMDYLTPQEQIGVRIEGVGNQTVLSTNITLKPFDPEILFYIKNTDGTVDWKKAISDNFHPIKTTTIIAVPYYFTPQNLSSVSSSWKRDGVDIGGGQAITVTPDDSGISSFEVSVENTKTFFQEAKKTLLLNL